MFKKEDFSNILKKINSTYSSMTEFAKKASFDRTYISKYINMKLNNPPTPKILEKLATASNGVTDYLQLMSICGYLSKSPSFINFYNNELSKIKQDILNVGISDIETNDILDLLKDYSNSPELHDKEVQEIIEKYPQIKDIIIGFIVQENNFLEYYLNNMQDLVKKSEKFKTDEFGNPVASIPVLGVVKAGYDYLAQENWIGTIDIDKKLYESGALFALKVKGDSMSPVLIEDDIVIIKKQDDFENGDIVVAIINGDEATIKKGKKSENSILFQPLNNNYEPLIFTYEEMKSIPVTIIGIVKELKRKF